MTRLISLALFSVLMGSIPAWAHHSLSVYNRSQSRTVEGVVKEFRFANPHARIILSVAAPDGSMRMWDFEGGSVSRLTRRGVTAHTISVGDKIKVSYNPTRSGRPGAGLFVGFTTADGTFYRTRR
jgi:hypothetical protein